MKIRFLEVKDIFKFNDLICDMLIDSYEINFQLKRQQCLKIGVEKIQQLKQYIEDGKATVIGALENEELIGLIWGYEHNYYGEKRVHINQIVVKEHFRGKGIGKRLLGELKNYAIKNNAKSLDLFVSENNNQALDLYEKMGFKNERRYMSMRM